MAEENIVIKIKADIGISKEVIEAVTKAMEGLGKTATIVSGNVKATNKNLEDTNKILGQVGQTAKTTGDSISKTGNSVKKSNMQWTNLALVIQDLPYGFRGIQNNLPALIGGMAGMTGAFYLAASAAIALYTAYDMGAFKSKEATEKAKEKTEALKKEKDAIDAVYNSTASETVEVTSLIAVLKSETETRNRKLDALVQLKKISPEIFDSLTLEKGAVVGLDAAYESYIKNLGTIIAVKIKQAELESIIEKRLKAEGVTLSQEEKDIKATGEALNANITARQTDYEQRLKNTKAQIKESKSQTEINKLKKQEADLILYLQQLSSGIKVTDTKTGKTGKTAEEIAADDAKLRIAYSEQVLQSEIKAKESEIQLSKDDYNQKAKLQLDLLALQKKYDLLKLQNSKFTEKEKANIALQIEEEYANRILLVNEQKNDSIFKSTEQSYSNRILLANGNLDKEKVIYEEEIYFLKKMLDVKFISQEEYEKKVAVLKNKVATIDKKQLNDKERDEKEIADRDFKNKMSAISNELKAKLRANRKDPRKQAVNYADAITSYTELGKQAGLTAQQIDSVGDAINSTNAAAQGTIEAFTPMADILNNLATGVLVEIGTQLGNLFSGESFSMDGFLSMIANALIQLGTHLVTISGLFKAFDLLFASGGALFGMSIPIGLAAIAIGTSLKNSISKKSNTKAFANGGIISGPTMGLMGEYPGAKTNPEVVAPLDKLKNLIGGSGGGKLEARISGNDLLILMNKAQRNNNLSF